MRVLFCCFAAGLGKRLKPPVASPGIDSPPPGSEHLEQLACLNDIQLPRAGNGVDVAVN